MDVNVELLSAEENRTTKVVAFITIATYILIMGGLFTEISSKLFIVLIAIFLSGMTFLTFTKGGIISLGSMNFSVTGLTIYNGEKTVFYALNQLANMKVEIIDYKGEVGFTLALIRPSSDGNNNFVWTDINNKKVKYRFDLISKNHRNRLIDRISEWQQEYPTIKM